MKETLRELDSLASGWIDEDRRRMESDGSRAKSDVIEVMLSLVDFRCRNHDPELLIKGTALVRKKL